MSEPKSETRSGASSRAARFGRRLATAIFWAGTLYLTTAGFTSITAQVFFPETATAPDGTDCRTALRALHAELLARAGEHAAAAGRSGPASTARWLGEWDRRHGSLRGVCTDSDAPAWASLERLRHRTEDSLVRVSRELLPLDRTFERDLAR